MSDSKWPYRLIAPGPVPVPPAVLRAMSEKVVHHRTPEFERVLVDVWSGLQMVFVTRAPVQVVCGTGSAAMEAAIVNTLSPDDEVLVVVSGKFGERWAEQCQRYGVRTHRWVLPWGQPADMAGFEAELRSHPRVKAVFTQVCETSTATVHPVREMARTVHALCPSALFCVDAITAAGCMPLPMDEWDIDVMVAGSQKAFMIPTGLSFIALSERAWTAAARARLPRFYLDLTAERKANERKETHFSTPTPLMIGLNMVLMRMREVGMERVMKRCETLAAATRAAGQALGLSTFSAAPSSSVTALNVEDSGRVRDWLEKERNITVMGGQDQLKGKILRVGHMGDVRDEDMRALFNALAEHLKRPFDNTALMATLAGAEPLF
ncbi:MAG: alanine--glyoxylate aminotransferase family protein [Bdellovibrionales bacterium]|nr:alanine--glyoxylate aminotransferase family protein [Bdellovibrionales bacterium]